MSTKLIVHITVPVENQPRLFEAIQKAASARAEQPGFIDAAIYVDENDPAHLVEVATWESSDHHQDWMAVLQERFAFDDMLALIDGPPQFTYGRAPGPQDLTRPSDAGS
jgi:heme-degrading monooxygenase HmoA